MMDANEFALGEREFERVRERLYDVAGISLSDAKRTMVIARLSRIVRTMKLASFAEYLDFLETKGTGADAQDFVNALTTNLTRFWREEHHFAHLIGHCAIRLSGLKLTIWLAAGGTRMRPSPSFSNMRDRSALNPLSSPSG